MTDINKTIAEVLRLDELSEVLSPAPWHMSGVDSQHVLDDADEATADAYCSNDATLIAYYRTAAPALAREVQRLQGEVERLSEEDMAAYTDGISNGFLSGSDAMRERAAAICEVAADERNHKATGDPYDEGWQDCAGTLMGRIEALEVEP